MPLPLQFETPEETKAFYAGFRDEVQKTAMDAGTVKSLGLLGAGAVGTVLLHKANEDRKLGRQVRKMQAQSQQGQ